MSQDPEKKIIVDEDWKTQVERERAAEEAGAAKPAADSDKPLTDAPLPPADLSYLVILLSLDAFASLGLMPGRKAEKNLPLAKHFIDLLEVLQQKTEGNRTEAETWAFNDTLHQLRMAFVQVAG